MNKIKIDAILVVEGTSDINYLSSFIDADFIKTNGSEISKETLNAIETLSKQHEIIILTDPDFPGKKIRNAVAERVPNAKHAFVRKEYSIKKHKVGVAECEKSEVLRALANVMDFASNRGLYEISLKTIAELNLFGENASHIRQKISEKLGFEPCNNKLFIKRLNQLNIGKSELEKLIKECE